MVKQRILKLRQQHHRAEKSTIEVMKPGEWCQHWGPHDGGEVVVTHADGSAERFQSEDEYIDKYEEI